MKIKLLLVLKDVHIMRLYKEEFEDDGYDVSEAYCGNEALEKIAAEKFDLIISDAVLPDIRTFELILQIRKTSPETKIITTSAYLISEIDDRIIWVADYFITKDPNMDRLKEVVKKLLK